jgi:hypothetical protein
MDRERREQPPCNRLANVVDRRLERRSTVARRPRRERAVLAIVHDTDRVAEICEQISAYFAFQCEANPRGFDSQLAAVWIADGPEPEPSVAARFAQGTEQVPCPLVEVAGVWSLIPITNREPSGAGWSHAGLLRTITQRASGVGASGRLLPVFRAGCERAGVANRLAVLRREFGAEILGEPMQQDRATGAISGLSLSGL